jgi:hypothetical protein
VGPLAALQAVAYIKDIGQLRGKALGCWCASEPCHGDVLAEQADVEVANGV